MKVQRGLKMTAREIKAAFSRKCNQIGDLAVRGIETTIRWL